MDRCERFPGEEAHYYSVWNPPGDTAGGNTVIVNHQFPGRRLEQIWFMATRVSNAM
jgi:hypothetical protein